MGVMARAACQEFGQLIAADESVDDPFLEVELGLNLLLGDLARAKVKADDQLLEIERRAAMAEQQAQVLREVATPIIVVGPGVLALPVIGTVDSERAADMMEKLLAKVAADVVTHVVIDITGVSVLDTRTTAHFMRLGKAVRLLGAECFLVLAWGPGGRPNRRTARHRYDQHPDEAHVGRRSRDDPQPPRRRQSDTLRRKTVPFTHSPFNLPSGKHAFRLHCFGTLTREDANEIRGLTNKGGIYCGLPELADLDADCELTTEFRETIIHRDEEASKIHFRAISIARGPKIRVATKFVVEVQHVSYRFFDSEELALGWLDSVAK